MKKIKEHISNNIKEYILVMTIFLIGIFLGVLFINNTKEEQILEITKYLNSYVENFKSGNNVEIGVMLKTSLLQNIGIGIALWFFGTTVLRNSCCARNNTL